MDLPSLLALAIGLSMDAAAVSAARGLAAPRLGPGHFVRVALYFGGFQALMPVVGFALGSALGAHVAAFAPWIACALLVGIGAKMLHEAWREARASSDDRDESTAWAADPFAWRPMLALAIATSIDSLAAGFTLPLLGASLAEAVITIGLTTAALSAGALWAGRRVGAVLGSRLDAVGGLVLVVLGAKVLVEHAGR